MKTNKGLFITAFTALVLVLMSGCSGMTRDEGQLIGIVGGAAVGSQVGKGDGRAAGIVIGAITGGYVGREAVPQAQAKEAQNQTQAQTQNRRANGGVCIANCKSSPKEPAFIEEEDPRVVAAAQIGKERREQQELNCRIWLAYCAENPADRKCRVPTSTVRRPTASYLPFRSCPSFDSRYSGQGVNWW